MAAGAFDDLPGAGKPLDLSDADDPNWWLRRKLEDEGLDASIAAPGALALRREFERLPDRVRACRTEAEARELLEDYNRRVREDRLHPAPELPRAIIAPLADVDAMLADRRA